MSNMFELENIDWEYEIFQFEDGTFLKENGFMRSYEINKTPNIAEAIKFTSKSARPKDLNRMMWENILHENSVPYVIRKIALKIEYSLVENE